tara:strand:- start:672 stop:860 length:189 start_codon:yes stop_codon:yes gene_type:complete
MKYKIIIWLKSNHFGDMSKVEHDMEQNDSIDTLLNVYRNVGQDGHTVVNVQYYEVIEDDDDV